MLQSTARRSGQEHNITPRAQALGFIYVDTGALYRTVGLNALRRGVDLEDPEAIAESVKAYRLSSNMKTASRQCF